MHRSYRGDLIPFNLVPYNLEFEIRFFLGKYSNIHINQTLIPAYQNQKLLSKNLATLNELMIYKYSFYDTFVQMQLIL